jgi:hypothetical protein
VIVIPANPAFCAERGPDNIEKPEFLRSQEQRDVALPHQTEILPSDMIIRPTLRSQPYTRTNRHTWYKFRGPRGKFGLVFRVPGPDQWPAVSVQPSLVFF